MMKKCFLICIAAFLLSSAAFADDMKLTVSSGETGETKITVSGCSGTVTMEVYNPGFSYKNITSENLKEALFDVREKKAENGSAEFVYMLPEDVNGFYTFVAGCGGEMVEYENPTAAEKKASLEEINKAKAEEIDAVLNRYNKIFQFDLEGDYALYKTEVYAALFSIRKNEYAGLFKNTEQTSEAFNKALAYGALNSADLSSAASIILKYKDILKIETEKNEEKFCAAIVNVRKKLTDGRYTAENMESAMKYVKALYSVNTADRVTMTDVLEKYAETLNISLDKYNKVDKIEANKALVDKDFKDAEEISAALNAKITEMNRKNNEPGGGSGGGGGGGSRSGGGGGGANRVVLPDNAEEVIKPAIGGETEYFGDIEDVEWAKAAINYFAAKGIINGEENNKFNPNGYVTREQFVKILAGAFGLKGESKTAFSDVESGAWYEPYVAAAAASGIVNGYNGKFGVGEYISREDVAVMLYRMAELENIALSGDKAASFKDAGLISDYAKDAVDALCGAEIISGFEDGEFKPGERCTRAQVCKLIYGIMIYGER